MLVELRGDAHCTVFPGSVHKSAEPIEFDTDGEPAPTTWDELVDCLTRLAVATVAHKNWQPTVKHDLSLCLSGYLGKAGWCETEVQHLIKVVAKKAGDPEIKDRLTSVRTTFERLSQQQAVSGRNDLIKLLGKDIVEAMDGWLNYSERPSSPSSGPATNPPADLFTDAGTADAFATSFSGELIYSDVQKQWYQRRNQIYNSVSAEIVQGIAKNFLQNRAAALTPQMGGPSPRSILTRQRINAVVELSRSRFWADATTFNANVTLLGCKDGTIFDLSSGALCLDPKEIVTKTIGTSFDANATCPKWEAFLDRIFKSDNETIKFVQRGIGYSLSGSTIEQCLFICVGTGANGKSTMLNVLQALMAGYAATVPMVTLMDQKGSSQTNDLASIAGRRLVVASEGERGQRLAESKIKLITGGDRVKCRYLYQEFFEFAPEFKLWLVTNNLPMVSGSDDAIWRRIRVIDFPVQIPADQQDRSLCDVLLNELPGILNWALAGYTDWKANGLCPPDNVSRSTKSYREENDIVGQWIQTCCHESPLLQATMRSLYDSYKIWCENSALEPLASNIFGKELTRRGFDSVKKKSGNERRGIGLRS